MLILLAGLFVYLAYKKGHRDGVAATMGKPTKKKRKGK